MLEIEPLVRSKIGIILLLFSSFVYSQSYPDYMVNFLLKSGIDKMLKQNYSGAELDFTELKNNFPDIPLGEISLNTLQINKVKDLALELNIDSFYVVLENSIQECEGLLEQNSESIWYNYFCGLAETNYAIFESELENYFSAYGHSSNAVEYLENCLAIDSLFYEAYGVIGAYKYWKSSKTEILHWLPFFSDETDIGLRYSKIASEFGNYNKFFTSSNLIWIYFDRGQLNEAQALADKLVRGNSENRSVKWIAARVYQEIDKYKSIELYQKLVDSYKLEINDNKVNEVILTHKIAMLYNELGEFDLALERCNYILGLLKLSNYALLKVEERLERVELLKSELDEKLLINSK